ncbi:MAG: hypothetical protein ACR2GY_08920 [Phycisphaerales bacterium]
MDRDDLPGTAMGRISPPVSNTERQRQFRERNPGYYGRLHRKRKEQVRVCREKRLFLEAWRKAHIEVKADRLLPAPHQVSCMSGSDFIHEIEEAIALRLAESVAQPRSDQAM